ncbi:enoyl-CoA hydratase/isomerase family protein [Actinomadura livida]|uniref:2-(1,2-epoxy-1,2-dihydrophenyl)acetyl-CoA isomerase n=1 Tax=Actinomadura livida TaxID=79909 RepID=A0A7W7MYQ0_9ACTN|nr:MULTISPECIES: enoyl-CoA hydratase-related protein [Actinomadura]MBB4776003.1 2-(1,2-epoxy-1,2-dihydrophenyl)acetyl-CoA isomerase [Actinomadura catellatispora]GGU16178.1 enoyl-CoA hydratase [Actinomadura livida]
MSNNSGGAAVPTGSGHLLAGLAGGVLTLTLNRPRVRNAFSREMLEALAAMLDYAAAADDVRVVVLTGSGGTFCAGGDLAMLAAGESIFGPADAPDVRLAAQRALQRATVVRLRDIGKPSVALIEGAAVGAGLGLALGCDLRYAGTSATLRTGFGRLGLAGDFGCTWSLNRLVGPSRALELLYLSPALTAARARDLGLVTEAVPDERLREHVAALAARLAAVSPEAVRAMRRHVDRARTHDLAACADAEAEWHVRLLESGAHRDAVRALSRGGAARTPSTTENPGAKES